MAVFFAAFGPVDANEGLDVPRPKDEPTSYCAHAGCNAAAKIATAAICLNEIAGIDKLMAFGIGLVFINAIGNWRLAHS